MLHNGRQLLYVQSEKWQDMLDLFQFLIRVDSVRHKHENKFVLGQI